MFKKIITQGNNSIRKPYFIVLFSKLFFAHPLDVTIKSNAMENNDMMIFIQFNIGICDTTFSICN